MSITKVPCGPRETAISRDWWLVVITVVIWCPLRILVKLRRAWNRHISFCQDSGDAGAHQASLILSLCNGLCFGACYKRSLWAQRNSHFTWPVASCGNGRCLMPITNCWQIKLVSTYDPQAYGPHTFFTTGFPRFLSIRGARRLLAINQVLI
jgi:hypothetical protein